jgi:hypothetical protein
MNIAKTITTVAIAFAITAGITYGVAAEVGNITAARAVYAAQAVQAAVPQSPAGDATTGQEQAVLAQSDTAGAQAVVTEDAKLAAQAKAARLAAIKKADDSTNDGSSWAPGEAPSGTPVPTVLITDPNNADYGKYEPIDPGTFCASRTASTVNGISVCD